MLALQRATGVRLHLLHMSTIGGWAMVRAAKAKGRPVSGEVNPFHLFVVSKWENVERFGPYCLGMWVPEHHAAAIWEAIGDGTADVIGSDHTPHTREEKEPGWTDMFATRDEAFAAERKLKGWSRAKKEALMAGDWALVSLLARGRTGHRRGADSALGPSTSSG